MTAKETEKRLRITQKIKLSLWVLHQNKSWI
jgi:hypothetical protein